MQKSHKKMCQGEELWGTTTKNTQYHNSQDDNYIMAMTKSVLSAFYKALLLHHTSENSPIHLFFNETVTVLFVVPFTVKVVL